MKLPIFAIDPGPEVSGWVCMDEYLPQHGTGCFVDGGVVENDKLANDIRTWPGSVAIEMIASYGMPVGKEVFETCVWIGRFIEAHVEGGGGMPVMVYRREVKAHLCAGNPKAKDANIRQALLDLFPRTGGGSCPQVGTKKKRGPLFGFNSHMWPALGVAITARDTK